MMVFEITIVVLLLVLNGFFAMSELAVVSARRGRLQRLAGEGDRGAQVALELASDPGEFLSSVQIGITLIGILAGAFSGATLAEKLGQWLDGFPLVAPYGSTIALVVVIVALTYLSLIFGELVPKQIALGNAERVAARVARPMRLVARIGGPVVAGLGWSSRVVLRFLGVQPRGDQTVTEEEIISLVAEGTEGGVFEKMERRMIEGVLRLADRPVRSIMTPRRNVAWIDPDDDPKEIAHRVLACDFSRFLVCHGSVEDVIGVVRKKDLLNLFLTGNRLDLRSVVRQMLVVPETVSVLKTLDLFRSQPVHMAIVVDEYGSFEGLVTQTDILEAIAGDLPSFADDADDPEIVQRDDGSLLLHGMLAIDDLREALGFRNVPEGDYSTLAGLILHLLARIPLVGEHVEFNGWQLEVVDMDGRRIDKVLASRLPDHLAS